jgi:hypothetical protein
MDPVSDRKNEFFTERLEPEPIEAVRFTIRPLRRELVKPIESARLRKNEFFFATVELEPGKALGLRRREAERSGE